ncbi:MAG: HEAT repeat domain-containing protein, partial [Proteobacteria bacterium]|nr:HEAT repeat domain-containing protein [Pseudomonadota bacterium]
ELLSDDSGELCRAAVKALGKWGTQRAIEPLLHCAQETSLFHPKIKREVETAKQLIQARLRNAEPGQLSLREPVEPEGALSFDRAGGQLSIASTTTSADDENQIAHDAEPSATSSST